VERRRKRPTNGRLSLRERERERTLRSTGRKMDSPISELGEMVDVRG